MKENEKINQYVDHARELKKLWNMKVTMILRVVSVLGTIAQGCKRCLEEA